MAWTPARNRFMQFGDAVACVRRIGVGLVFAYAVTSVSLGGSPAARWVFYGAVVSWTGFILVVAWPCGRGQGKANGPVSTLLHRLELLSVNIALTLLFAEAALRCMAFCSCRSPLLSDTLDSYRLAPGRDYGSGLRGNSLGYPGPEFVRDKQPGVFRIAALGDSFAVGPCVSFEKNYLSLLASFQPATEVYNFGVSGTGPREYHFILNQHVWAYQPDLVLVSVFVGNDITEWLATPRHMDPRQSALYLLLTRGGRVLREGARQDGALQRASVDRLSGSGLSPEAFLEVEARRLANCYKAPPAGLEKKWQRALGYLDLVIRDCRAHHVPVAFVLIPDEFQVNPQVLADVLAATGMKAADVDLQEPQRRLKAFLIEREAPCLDLLPAFAGHPDTYAPRDTHWNERGNELAASSIARWLNLPGGGPRLPTP